MNKIISFILLCALLIICFSGCAISNGANGDETPNKENSPTENEEKDNTPVIIEGELDKSSDLVVTLVTYLDQYMAEYHLTVNTFTQKVDDIKAGIQPLHVAFDPSNYYFVCGYYNSSSSSSSSEFGYYQNCKKYTWVGYKNASDVKEYYNDTKWAVLFQINRALIVTDIVSNERQIPDIEHFQIINPTFENGVNIADPVVFDETFIYLNYPNCDLNRFSQSDSTMYYCNSIYYHGLVAIPCVYFNEKYYIATRLYTIFPNGAQSNKNIAHYFGEYYDCLVDFMDTESYSETDDEGRTTFFVLIEIDDFVNCIKNKWR